MKKHTKLTVAWAAIIAIALAAGGIWAYRKGLLWRSTFPLSDLARETNVCPLHSLPLKTEKIEVSHTIVYVTYMPGFLEDFWKASRERFPWANSGKGNDRYGCEDLSIGWQMIKYCDRCREEEVAWIEDWSERWEQKVLSEKRAEQAGTGHSTTRSLMDSEGHKDPQPKVEERTR